MRVSFVLRISCVCYLDSKLLLVYSVALCLFSGRVVTRSKPLVMIMRVPQAVHKADAGGYRRALYWVSRLVSIEIFSRVFALGSIPCLMDVSKNKFPLAVY